MLYTTYNLGLCILEDWFLYPERTLSEAKGYLNVAFFFVSVRTSVRLSVRPSVRTSVTKIAKGRTQDGQTQDGHKRGK